MAGSRWGHVWLGSLGPREEAIRLSLSDLAVVQQAISFNVHNGWATEIGTTDYAPTCGRGVGRFGEVKSN